MHAVIPDRFEQTGPAQRHAGKLNLLQDSPFKLGTVQVYLVETGLDELATGGVYARHQGRVEDGFSTIGFPDDSATQVGTRKIRALEGAAHQTGFGQVLPGEAGFDEQAGIAYANLLFSEEGQLMLRQAGFASIR